MLIKSINYLNQGARPMISPKSGHSKTAGTKPAGPKSAAKNAATGEFVKKRVLLRCPVCGRSTPMPAANCAHCRADFLTGYRQPRFGRLGLMVQKALSYGAALAVLALIGGGIWLYMGHKTPVRPAAQPTDFQILAAENPNLLRPYILVHRARDAVMEANEKLYHRQDFIRQMREVDQMMDQESAEYIRQTSPQQRARMLKDLSRIVSSAGGQDGDLSGYDLVTTTPAQRQKMLEELEKTK